MPTGIQKYKMVYGCEHSNTRRVRSSLCKAHPALRISASSCSSLPASSARERMLAHVAHVFVEHGVL
eukprot:1891318-Rhodomonas_salina.2